MPDMEKIIYQLEKTAEFLQKFGFGGFEAIRNAITLLKEQEAKTKHCNDIALEYAKEVFRLQTLLKEQGWNVLTEDADGVIHGLPGDDGQYLMTDGKDIWIDDYVDGVTDGIILDSGRDIREITAWMHMPELPKKDRR